MFEFGIIWYFILDIFNKFVKGEFKEVLENKVFIDRNFIVSVFDRLESFWKNSMGSSIGGKYFVI